MKSQTTFLLVLATLLILGSIVFNNENFISDKVISTARKITSQKQAQKPEFQITNFKTRKFSESGLQEYQLSAFELLSFSNNEKAILEQPDIDIFSSENGDVSWKLLAENAESTRPHTSISLKDSVSLRKLAQENGEPPLSVETQALQVLTDKKIARSDILVNIRSEKNTTKGVGFQADLESDQLKLMNNVESVYQGQEKSDPELISYISSDRFTLNNKTQKASYEGNAIFTRGNVSISAEKIDLIKTGEEQLAFIYGNPAKFLQDSRFNERTIKAEALRFEYDSTDRILKMFEQAKLEQNDAIVEGDYLYYDTKTENISAESKENSRVKMVLPSKKN
jgi:lipopolysaccharide export system protein LptA